MTTAQLPAELQTVRDFIRYAVSEFNRKELYFGHGSNNPWDEACYLVLRTLQLPLDRLEPFLDARLTVGERTQVWDIIRDRIERRVPAAYLTREAWLGDFRFYVDERVIVPRSYIAELLAEHLSPWLDDPEAVGSALDLCTGSGCLAILLAHAFPEAKIDAVDLSPDALAVARRNVDDYGLADQIELIQSDVFAALDGRSYDLIISNPPYVTGDAMRALPAEYRAEPAMALAAGEDGLDVVRVILAEAGKHLNDGGLLVVEVGHNADLVEAAFPDLPLTWVDTPSDEGKVFLLRKEHLTG